MKTKDIFEKSKRNIITMSVGIVIGCMIVFAVITQLLYKARLFENVDEQLRTHRNMIRKDPGIIKIKGTKEEVVIPAPMTPNLISFAWKEDKIVDEGPHAYLGEKAYPVFPKGYHGEVITLTSSGYNYRAISFEKEGLIIQLLVNVDAQLHSVEQLQLALFIAFLTLILIALILASYLAAASLKAVRLAYEKQVFFVQDASHEMRTPLAVIKGQIELLAREPQDTIEEHIEGIADIIKEIRGLEKLNSDLLTLSKQDVGVALQSETFSLNDFMQNIQEFYLDLAELQEKHLDIQKLEEDVQVTWDAAIVKRCIIILLENAFKYTEAEDHIRLVVKLEGKFIQIQVSDSGMGIKKEEQSRVFDRFFRSQEVRSKGIEGTGIGLSLLKALAYSLGIKVNFNSEYGQGTEFTLIIPEKM